MTQYQYARWLYEQTGGTELERWEDLPPATHNQWVRLAALIQADRRNLAIRLLNGMNNIWTGLGHPLDGGIGTGFRELRDLGRELDPKAKIA